MNIGNFKNFAKLRPDISNTGGRTKKRDYVQNLLKVVKIHWDKKKTISLLHVRKFCPLAKNCHDKKCLPNIYF